MTKIKNYTNDNPIDLKDKLIGTESSTGNTKNYEIQEIVNLVNGVSGKDYIQYQFSLTDYIADGSFTTNASKTNPTEITKLYFNKLSLKKEDLSELFNKLDTLLNISINFRNPADTNNFVVFKITNITSHLDYFEFDVVLYKNFYSGLLSAETIYSAYFDIKENFEDKTDKFIKSNESLSLASRKGDVLYGILDQYTGEEMTLSKVTGTPTVDNIIYFQIGAEYFKRNYTQINVDWFGCVGDGITDDTVNIQKALTTDCEAINFTRGKSYLIDGGLTSSVTNRKINLEGSTIKLKDTATVKGMFTVSGSNTIVKGGIWDGNRVNGNEPVDTYSSWNIDINANNCTVDGITSINTYGISIKGEGTVSYAIFKNNNLSGFDHYGIFIDSNGTVNQVGNKAIGNTIDCSTNATRGQGILFTSILASGFYQTDWEVSDNKIIGSAATTTDQAICLAVRGHRGIFSNNITKYGSMGISEGGDNTIYSSNIISDCPVASISYGIELSGSNAIVSNNIIKNVNYGIIGSGNYYDNTNVVGNTIKTNSLGLPIYFQISISAKNINISSNNISGKYGVYTSGNVTGMAVTGNSFLGEGVDVNNGRGVFLNTPSAVAKIFVSGNKFSKFQRAFAIYSDSAISFSELYALGNDISDDNSGVTTWNVEGSAIIGNNVSSSWGGNNEGNKRHTIDQAKNTYIMWSENFNNPEGLLTAGIGSIFYSLNEAGGVYFKLYGTGNTGWVPMFKTYNTMLSQADSTAIDVAGLVADFNALVLKLKNSSLMTV